MATETSTMAETRISQVRIQLSSRSPDIELPEDTGPILVSTGMTLLTTNEWQAMAITKLTLCRTAQIPIVDSC